MAAPTGVLVLFLVFLGASSCEGGPIVQVTPSVNDRTVFEGTMFRRLCSVTGVAESDSVQIEWLRDGRVLDRVAGLADLHLEFIISSVTLVHEGEYACHVVVTHQSGGTPVTTLDPTSAGHLTVLALSAIAAPPTQVIGEGNSSRLQCSYPGGAVRWYLPNGTRVDGEFSPATIADENVYTCEIFIPGAHTSTRVDVMLFVVAPIEILEKSRVHHNLTSNRPLQLTVDFIGRASHNLSISWFHDGTLLSNDIRISTSFDSVQGRGRAELRFPEVRRRDSGLYRVVLRSELVEFFSQEEATFQIDVTVRPLPPRDLRVDQVSSRTARVSWVLPPSTADQVADSLQLRITFANHSFFDFVSLSGEATERALTNLIPAHDYIVVVTAVNRDGEVTSSPQTISTTTGFPSISNLNMERLNVTSFQLILQLAYTGGGVITSLRVSYKPTASRRLETEIPVTYQQLSTLWLRGVVTLTDIEEAMMPLTFFVSVRNTFHFQSPVSAVNVSADAPPVTTPTLDTLETTLSTDSLEADELLPYWLVAVIACVVTVLTVACIVGLCLRCTIRRRKSSTFKPEAPSPIPTNMAQQVVDSSRLADRSSPTFPEEQYHVHSQSSLAPSDNYTSSLEEQFKKKHHREASECSSLGVNKGIVTPSTTASNSPSNFYKAPYLNSQDKGLDSILESEMMSRGSDDSSTESERDRLRQQEFRAKMRNVSPCSRNNIINCQFVEEQQQRGQRGHADGSVCGSSHQSLVGSSHQSLGCTTLGSQHSIMYSYQDPKQPPTRRRGNAEYMYSDCESVASTDVSYSNVSLPSPYTALPSRPLQSVHGRSQTPYAYPIPEAVDVSGVPRLPTSYEATSVV